MEQKKLSKYKTVGDYALKSKIGESSNSLSTVWKAEHLSSGDVVAVKQVYVEKLNKHLKSCLDCELNFLSSVNHPNIIRLFDAFQVSPLNGNFRFLIAFLAFVEFEFLWFG